MLKEFWNRIATKISDFSFYFKEDILRKFVIKLDNLVHGKTPLYVAEDSKADSADYPTQDKKAITYAVEDGLLTDDQAAILLTVRDFAHGIGIKSRLDNQDDINDALQSMIEFFQWSGRSKFLGLQGNTKYAVFVVKTTVVDFLKAKIEIIKSEADYYDGISKEYNDNQDIKTVYSGRSDLLQKRLDGIKASIEFYQSDKGSTYLANMIISNRELFISVVEDAKKMKSRPSIGDLMRSSGFIQGNDNEVASKIESIFLKKAEAELKDIRDAVSPLQIHDINVYAKFDDPVDRVKTPKIPGKYLSMQAQRGLIQVAMNKVINGNKDITVEQIKDATSSGEETRIAALQKIYTQLHAGSLLSSSNDASLPIINDFYVSIKNLSDRDQNIASIQKLMEASGLKLVDIAYKVEDIFVDRVRAKKQELYGKISTLNQHDESIYKEFASDIKSLQIPSSVSAAFNEYKYKSGDFNQYSSLLAQYGIVRLAMQEVIDGNKDITVEQIKKAVSSDEGNAKTALQEISKTLIVGDFKKENKDTNGDLHSFLQDCFGLKEGGGKESLAPLYALIRCSGVDIPSLIDETKDQRYMLALEAKKQHKIELGQH